LNVGEGRWEKAIFVVALFASVIAIVDRRFRPALILWVPLPFYMWAIAYGGVPIFVPEWWPFAYYNVRYGIHLLPALAVFIAVAYEILRRVNWKTAYNTALPVLAVVLIVGSYVSVLRATPIVIREGRADSKGRVPLENALATELMRVPPSARLLMFVGSHSGSIQKAGIPYRRILYEGNFDRWQGALQHPSRDAQYVVATDGDLVANAVKENPTGLEAITILQSPGRPRTVIYKSIGNETK
jgi:hypothetical protein